MEAASAVAAELGVLGMIAVVVLGLPLLVRQDDALRGRRGDDSARLADLGHADPDRDEPDPADLDLDGVDPTDLARPT